MSEKLWSDIETLQHAYKDGQTTPTQVVEWYLERIEKYNSKLNIYLTVTKEAALAKASEQDKLLKTKPEILSELPLFGVPLAHKDLFMTKGVRTTAGSKVLENYIAQYDSTAVKKLNLAGAITLGKLNCDGWAHGSSGENSDFGPTRNPWNADFVPGGSSSGSGAVIAADMALVATGTDTGGSIRAPASFCGVVGIKPTYGRVSRYGVIAMASSLDSVGHLTNTVKDSARVLRATAGKDPLDATTSPGQVPDYTQLKRKDLKGLKIGIPKEFISNEGMDADTQTKVGEATEKLKELGAQIVDISLPHTPQALAVYYIIQPAEVSSNLGRFDGIRFGNGRNSFGAEAKRRIMLGTYTLSAGYYDAYYKTAQKVRSLVVNDFSQAFSEVDLIAGPVMPHTPFKIGEKVSNPLALYLEDILTVPMNLAGVPAISIPVGFSKEMLPIGMQLIAPQFKEELIFEAASIYEQNTDWHTKRPNLN